MPMYDMPLAPQALVLEADPDVAAVLSLQFELLGLEARYHHRSASLLEALLTRPPRLVVLGLEFGSEDGRSPLPRWAGGVGG